MPSRTIGEARTVAVAVLQAEVGHPADDQAEQSWHRCSMCRRHELGQNIHSREPCRVGHQRQIDKLLDRAAPELPTRCARIRAATSSLVGCGDQSMPTCRR